MKIVLNLQEVHSIIREKLNLDGSVDIEIDNRECPALLAFKVIMDRAKSDKIAAIKDFRALFGYGLYASKQAVENPSFVMGEIVQNGVMPSEKRLESFRG